MDKTYMDVGDLEAFRSRATRPEFLDPAQNPEFIEGLVDRSQGRGALDRLNSEH
jgi:hypothetical protein